MTEQRVLPKVLRLRAERIAKVHFDEVYITDDLNVVQGKLPDGKYVLVNLLTSKVLDAPESYHTELQKKVDAGIMAQETEKTLVSAITRESVTPLKKVRKLSTSNKSSKLKKK